MKTFHGTDGLEPDDGAFVTVGTFDGVHRGHQAILHYLRDRARARQGRSVVVTFDPHPRAVLSGVPVPLLTTIDERADRLAEHGIDRFVVLPFTEAFATLPPERFVLDVLLRGIGLREIVVGYDHGFGQGRRGDRALLERLGAEHGFGVDVVPVQEVGEAVVSSTHIRQLLRESGDVRKAAVLLGRPYALGGRVVRGDGRGRTIGFPTANLALEDARKAVPARGVYAVQARTEDGARHGGMMNIGLRPTFGGTEEHLEVHLFDFDADLYGQPLRIEFVERLRDERRFGSVGELIEQLSRDRSRCRTALEGVS